MELTKDSVIFPLNVFKKLHPALYEECLNELVQKFVSQGTTANGNKPLMNMILNTDKYPDLVDRIPTYIEENPESVNQCNRDGRSVLHFTIVKCPIDTRMPIIKILLNHGADPNIPDLNEKTCLMSARDQLNKMKSVELISLLIQSGANVNSYGINISPLSYFISTVECGRNPCLCMESISLLLRANAEVNLEGKRSPLYAALCADLGTCHRRNEILSLLIQAGAVVNNTISKHALHFAVNSSASEDIFGIITQLLTIGADINTKDDYGRTPLIYAAKHERNYKGRVKILVSLGADVKLRDNAGHDAKYHYMKSFKRDWRDTGVPDPQVVKLLKYDPIPVPNDGVVHVEYVPRQSQTSSNVNEWDIVNSISKTCQEFWHGLIYKPDDGSIN